MARKSTEYLPVELLSSITFPKLRKHLCDEGMYLAVKEIFSAIPNQVKSSQEDAISLSDCLMSALGMFSLKYPSLLKFDQDAREDVLKHNLNNLYCVDTVPCDSYMRERIDEVDPKDLRKAFTYLFSQLQRGKVLEDFRFLDGYYLLSMDGSRHFYSDKISCENCCVNIHKNGKKSFYHNVFQAVLVHPSTKIRTVFPFAPEPITKKDGQTKNDCEQSAAKRFLENLKREHPHLKIIFTADSLHATGPLIKMLLNLGHRFILNVKPGSHKKLFEKASKRGTCQAYRKMENGEKFRYRFVNGVPINNSHPDVLINYLECRVTDTQGKPPRALRAHNKA